MSENTLNNQLNDEFDHEIQAIATSIFFQHGTDFSTVQKAGGWSNAVWFSDKMVLRLSTIRENTRLLQEAKLATLFPPDVGYPKILKTGTSSGYSWTLAEKIPGMTLGEIWPELNWEGQIIALQSMWERAQAVHSVPVDKAIQFARKSAWFNTTDASLAESSLRRLAKEKIISTQESHVLKNSLSDFWRLLPTSCHVLCHGDLTMDNAIWYDNEVVSLLDFEFAVVAPVQLDLNHLIKCAYSPEENKYTTSNPDIQGVFHLRQAIKDMAIPLLSHPDEKILLMGYAILLELWLLETWLEHPEREGALDEWDPLKRLRSLADGKSGYLASMFNLSIK